MADFNPEDIVTWCIIATIVGALLVLGGLTIYEHDFTFIFQQPGTFILELLVVGVVPALAFLVFIYTRGIESSKMTKAVSLLALKFGLLHALFQTSGYYTYILPYI
jgi:hypothetical protein